MDERGSESGWDTPPFIAPARRLDGTPTNVLAGVSARRAAVAVSDGEPVHLGVQAAKELVTHLTRIIRQLEGGDEG